MTGSTLGYRIVVGVLLGLGIAASAHAQQAPPVAARDLPRGIVLTAEDIKSSSGAGADESGVVGWRTRRVIEEGEPLQEPAVVPPDLVSVGDVVQLLWQRDGIELRMVGRALNSAARGEQVNVRVDVRRRFRGVVVGPGLVRLTPDENGR